MFSLDMIIIVLRKKDKKREPGAEEQTLDGSAWRKETEQSKPVRKCIKTEKLLIGGREGKRISILHLFILLHADTSDTHFQVWTRCFLRHVFALTSCELRISSGECFEAVRFPLP